MWHIYCHGYFSQWKCTLKIHKKIAIRIRLAFPSFERQRVRTYLLTYAPNEDSDQLAHSRSLIRVFVVRMKKVWILGYPKCAQWRFWSDCANAQADLNLRWAHMSKGTFYDFVARLFWLIELGFNDTSTLVGHFVSSPRENEKIDRRDSRRDEKEGQGRKRNRNESEETEEIKTSPPYPYLLQG